MASSFLFWYKDKLIFSGVGGGGGRRSLFGKSSAKTFLENSFCGWLGKRDKTELGFER